MQRKIVASILVMAIVVVASYVGYQTYFAMPSSPCSPINGGSFARSHLTNTTFGAVTEWALPSQGRYPNAVAAAPDGSVWFAEEEVPGVAHLYPNNGTLVEYAWPGYPTPRPPNCLYSVSSSGIALWNGRIWAADEFGNAILGLGPGDGSVVSINASKTPYPYWLAAGPDGNLWFTSDNTPARLGRIYPNLTMSVINLSGLGQENPIQLGFVNSSMGLLSTVNEGENTTTKTCLCTGHIYSFDPSNAGTEITPLVVGGGYKLVSPTSVSYSKGKIWVAQHGPSSVLSYDFGTRSWTAYPTSIVRWSTSLPYVIAADRNAVWFNEHYANKIAILNGPGGTLTEISESNPPASNASGIQNDVSISLANGGLWFTSLTGNYVGYVSGSYRPSFRVSPSGAGNTVVLSPGGTASVSLTVSGAWAEPMRVNVSDSETYLSIPKLIHMVPGVAAIPVGSSPYELNVRITVDPSIVPGDYTVAVTLTNGGVQQSAYFFVHVK